MGSGTLNRKKTDNTYIRVPKNSAAFGGLSSIPNDSNFDICIPSFDVKLKQVPLIKARVKVNLDKQGETYIISVGATKVGIVNAKYSKMISHCASLSVTYKGEIVEVKNNFYARFVRFSG